MLKDKDKSKVSQSNLRSVHGLLDFSHMNHKIFILESSKTVTIHLSMFKFQKLFLLFYVHFNFVDLSITTTPFFRNIFSLVLAKLLKEIQANKCVQFATTNCMVKNTFRMNFSSNIITTCAAATAAALITSISHLWGPFSITFGTQQALNPKQEYKYQVSWNHKKRIGFWYLRNGKVFM